MKPTTTPKKTRQSGAGRPQTLANGKRVLVYLDSPTLAAAEALGGGNVSKGIRRALSLYVS
jgi:hypothetical protein